MTNLPILYQNALSQYSHCEAAQKAWLWFADNHDNTRFKYKADKYANEVMLLVETLKPLISKAARIIGQQKEICVPETVLDDELKFILKRHANDFLGGNVKVGWYA